MSTSRISRAFKDIGFSMAMGAFTGTLSFGYAQVDKSHPSDFMYSFFFGTAAGFLLGVYKLVKNSYNPIFVEEDDIELGFNNRRVLLSRAAFFNPDSLELDQLLVGMNLRSAAPAA
jgi:hypothetical protein